MVRGASGQCPLFWRELYASSTLLITFWGVFVQYWTVWVVDKMFVQGSACSLATPRHPNKRLSSRASRRCPTGLPRCSLKRQTTHNDCTARPATGNCRPSGVTPAFSTRGPPHLARAKHTDLCSVARSPISCALHINSAEGLRATRYARPLWAVRRLRQRRQARNQVAAPGMLWTGTRHKRVLTGKD